MTRPTRPSALITVRSAETPSLLPGVDRDGAGERLRRADRDHLGGYDVEAGRVGELARCPATSVGPVLVGLGCVELPGRARRWRLELVVLATQVVDVAEVVGDVGDRPQSRVDGAVLDRAEHAGDARCAAGRSGELSRVAAGVQRRDRDRRQHEQADGRSGRVSGRRS